MADRAFLDQLKGFSLTTAEILYKMPDHPSLLQSYIWQDYDLSPQGRPVRDRSRNRDRQDNGPRVGFQDNIPAFLRKPVRA